MHSPPSPMLSTLPHPPRSFVNHHQCRPPAQATPLFQCTHALPTRRFQSLGSCSPDARRRFSVFLRTRWFAVARFSPTKSVGPAIAARKSRPNPRTCSDRRHKARAGGCGVGGVGVCGGQGRRGRAGWWRVEEAGGRVGRAGCEAAPHSAPRRAQNVGIYGRGRSRGKRGRECAHAERRDRSSSAGR